MARIIRKASSLNLAFASPTARISLSSHLPVREWINDLHSCSQGHSVYGKVSSGQIFLQRFSPPLCPDAGCRYIRVLFDRS